MKKQNNGITLIALVITIIILLILAGIAISSLIGSGLFDKAKDVKLQTEIANIEDEANLIYSELAIDYYTGKADAPTMEKIVSMLTAKGYKIEKVSTSGSTITGISLDKETIKLAPNEIATLTIVKYESDIDSFTYYAIIGDKYYKITKTGDQIKIERTASEVNKSAETEILTAVSSNPTNVIVEGIDQNTNTITLRGGASAGTSTIAVKYGTTLTATCETTLVIKPAKDSPEEDMTFSTAYGKIDVIWLKGTTNDVSLSGPNAPIITATNGEEMTPVKWDETNKEVPTTYTDSDWYNYTANNEACTASRWANAQTANGSYFVWIPRYAYRITYYASETSTEPTGYYDGFGQWKASDGKIRLALDRGVETVDYNGDKYIVHPAFDNNVNVGGWSDKISGFWFAKFEMSGATGAALQSVPGVQSTRSTGIKICYNLSRTATFGYTGTIDTVDGKTSYMNSHLVKNSEWGAVAYLTHSKFGRDGKVISENRNSSHYTGGSSDETYKTNIAQSTTGNVYGIYDMSGGSDEFVAAFNIPNTRLSDGWEGLSNNSESTKYATKYTNTQDATSGNNIVYTYGKVGDATKEVNEGGEYNKTASDERHLNWFSQLGDIADLYNPYFKRSGYHDGFSRRNLCRAIESGYRKPEMLVSECLYVQELKD